MDFGREVDILSQDKVGCNLLHHLSQSGCYKGWRFILGCLKEEEKGVMLSAQAKNKDTVLIIACKEQTNPGHIKIIKSILSEKYYKHCDINVGGESGRTALYRAWLRHFFLSLSFVKSQHTHAL